MYPFERFVKVLKGYVRNRARPEGCIAECYLVEECVRHCSAYINIEVKEHERNEFVQVRKSLEWKQLSTKMKQVRSKVTYPYTLSRKGYARLEHDLKSEKGNDESIPRVELWIKGRIKKDGNVVNRASMVTMKKIKESSQDPNYKSSFSIKDDLLSQVIGPEHPGCVRGLGFGATSSNINAQLQVVSWKQAMNNKVNEVMERQKVMEEIISQLTSSMNIGRNGVGNACASKDVLASHRDDNGNLEGKPCKLLHWIASGEVVAYGEISSTDPSALVDDVPLGPDCYKVWVRDVLISNIALPRPSRLHFTVDDAMASTVAWPSKYIDLF